MNSRYNESTVQRKSITRSPNYNDFSVQRIPNPTNLDYKKLLFQRDPSTTNTDSTNAHSSVFPFQRISVSANPR